MNTKQKYWVLGSRHTYLLSSPSLLVFESESPEGNGPPPHIHELEDESFYVIEGRLEILRDKESFTAAPGDFVNIPKGMLHTYKTASSRSRVLVMVTPGGLDELFRLVGHPAGNESSDPHDVAPAVQKLLELAPRFHLVIPPPKP